MGPELVPALAWSIAIAAERTMVSGALAVEAGACTHTHPTDDRGSNTCSIVYS